MEARQPRDREGIKTWISGKWGLSAKGTLEIGKRQNLLAREAP
jgi:hypothetical protein